MPHPSFLILYVDHPATSAAFYAGLLGQQPVEASPTFALFALPSGLRLGLWSRHTVTPPPSAAAGGGELAFVVEGPEAVDATYRAWSGQGLSILQDPTELDFGRSFVAVDPDGHRLRVFAPAQG